MKNERITVITVVSNLIANGRKTSFLQCLKSIHEQTYENIEHIVIDNDSQDGTRDLLEKYRKKGWIRYLSEPDKGIYDAMNKGIKLSSGDYIAFLNSDDYYHKKDGIEISMNYLTESGATFSYSPVRVLKDDGKEYIDHPYNSPNISNVFFRMPFSHQSMIVSKELISEMGGFETKYTIASDYDMVIKLCLRKAKSVYVPYSFVTYSYSGISSTQVEKSLNEIKSVFDDNFNRPLISQSEVDGIRQRVFTEVDDFYTTFPADLAYSLKDHFPYFDYSKFVNANGNLPKLSIVTITYNNQNLYKTLESVSNQLISPDQIEHIIVDNLSTDNTEQIVNEYKKSAPYDVIYIREKDTGRYNGMNKGIRRATHEYINFLNGGDHFYDEFSVKNLLAYTEEKDIVYGDLEVIDGDNISIYSPPDEVNLKYFFSESLPHQATIIRRNLFEKIGYYDEDLKIASDYKFFVDALFNHHVSYKHIKKTISTYYMDGISSDKKYTKVNEIEKNKLLIDLFCHEGKRVVGGGSTSEQSDYDTPILFLIFNRPTKAQKVFNQIRKIKPKYLYVVADGPRDYKEGELERSDRSRSIIDQVDWDCEVHTLFRNKNFGCGGGVSKGISWFFSHVNEGIILEDDCFPDESFFYFCSEMLSRYRDDKNVTHINGTVLSESSHDSSYYFSKFFNIWGWATWKRAWEDYDYKMSTFPQYEIMSEFWLQNFRSLYYNKLDTWDFQWSYANFRKNTFSIMPTSNLVSNIGFGKEATHTHDESDHLLANKKLSSIDRLIEPKADQLNDLDADFDTYLQLGADKVFQNIRDNRILALNQIDPRLGYLSNAEVKILLVLRKIKRLLIPENSIRRKFYVKLRNLLKAFLKIFR